MNISPPLGFSWDNCKCFTAFDSLIKEFICGRKSWLLKTPESIDPEAALDEIRQLFVEGFDAGKDSFDSKAQIQFTNASRAAKIVFSHAEYLWAMHSVKISKDTKRSYALRWFSDEEVRDDEEAYFDGRDNSIANPGPHYQTNKYNEVRAILRIFSLAFDHSLGTRPEEIKRRIKIEAYRALEGSPKPVNGFAASGYCGVHPALMHLADPEEYESIISKSHRESILGVFSYIIADLVDVTCNHEKIKMIRERLYDNYEHSDPVYKYRWFFYIPSVKPLWFGKDTEEQLSTSIQSEIDAELNSEALEGDEGQQVETKGFRIMRSAALVKSAKKRDEYRCRSCGFYFKGKIVQAHHLDPLAERKRRKTTLDDLVTLCPNCHYLAHYQLRDKKHGDDYKQIDTLLEKLQNLVRE